MDDLWGLQMFDEIEMFEEIEELFPDRRPYMVQNRKDHFIDVEATNFFKRFRLQNQTVQLLLQEIEQHLTYCTNRNNSVTPMTQLLLTLRFFATGSMYIVVADFAGVAKATAGKIISKVSCAIARLRPEYIYLPRTVRECNKTVKDFFNIARFSRTLGAIDCTRVRTQSPGEELAENFCNRKRFFSIKVQGVYNAELKFTDTVARWPGASHDSNIFDQSMLRARCKNEELGDNVLLGDSGYAVCKYLNTPLANSHTPADNLFNEAHTRTRNVIERTFGVWKRRFPVFPVGMRCTQTLNSIFETLRYLQFANNNK